MSADAAPSAEPPRQRRGSVGAILANAGWLLGGKGVAAVLSTLYLAIVTRTLGLEGFGRFALAVGIAQTVTGLATFQSWQVIVRYGMPRLHAGERAPLARLMRFGAQLDAVSALIGAALLAAGFLLLGPRFGWDPRFRVEALLALLPLALAVHSAPTGILRLHDRFALASVAESMLPVVRFVGAVTAWLIAPRPLAFLIAWSVAEVATCAAYWLAVWRTVDVDLGAGGRVGLATIRAENPGIVRYALVTNASASLDQGGKQGIVLLMGLMVGPVAAGGFRFAQQLSQAVAKLSQTLARAIFPELMRSHAQDADDEGGFERLFRRTARLAALGGGVMVMLLLIAGRPALGLIAGAAFVPVYPVLLVLGLAAAVDFAAVGFEPALAAQGRAGTGLTIRFGSILLLLVSLWPLAHWYGILGGAGAVLAASVTSFAVMRAAVRANVVEHRQPQDQNGDRIAP